MTFGKCGKYFFGIEGLNNSMKKGRVVRRRKKVRKWWKWESLHIWENPINPPMCVLPFTILSVLTFFSSFFSSFQNQK